MNAIVSLTVHVGCMNLRMSVYLCVSVYEREYVWVMCECVCVYMHLWDADPAGIDMTMSAHRHNSSHSLELHRLAQGLPHLRP